MIAYSSLQRGINKLEVNNDKINQDLDNAWEVIAEPIQTVMRRYGVDNPYEKLKELTRGKCINQEVILNFINSLDIPNHAKKDLLKISPSSYTGLASKLTSNFN